MHVEIAMKITPKDLGRWVRCRYDGEITRMLVHVGMNRPIVLRHYDPKYPTGYWNFIETNERIELLGWEDEPTEISCI